MSQRLLHISEDLFLPQDAVTRTLVVYGGRGKGKTNFGAVLCEELYANGLKFCVTDPLDVWWGLQHGAKRGDRGLEVVVLGGAHGDMPIDPTAGEVLADFVVDESVSTILVMRRATGEPWSSGERIRFMRDFVKRLFSRQGERRIPLHLVIDESGRFIPQLLPKGSVDIAECVGAIEELVEWGRNYGLGCTLITQRSARMNKSVSELAECMVSFQTSGPNSVAAIVDWFGEHIPKDRHKELVEELRKLPVGTALVVSPEWLGFEGKVLVRRRTTFDSSATPKAGQELRVPGKAKKPDLAKYRARLEEVTQRAKSDDPRELKKTIGELSKQLEKLQKQHHNGAVSSPALRQGELAKAISDRDKHWQGELRKLQSRETTYQKRLQQARGLLSRLEPLLVDESADAPVELPPPPTVPRRSDPAIPATIPLQQGSLQSRETNTADGGRLGPAHLRVMRSLYWLKDEERTPAKVAFFAGYTVNGHFNNTIGNLRSRGLVIGWSLTGQGLALLPDVEEKPTGAELREWMRSKLDAAGNKLLDVLILRRGERLSAEELAAAAGYTVNGHFNNVLGRLRTLQIAEGYAKDGGVRVADMFLD